MCKRSRCVIPPIYDSFHVLSNAFGGLLAGFALGVAGPPANGPVWPSWGILGGQWGLWSVPWNPVPCLAPLLPTPEQYVDRPYGLAVTPGRYLPDLNEPEP
jgi:hypothetical protein